MIDIRNDKLLFLQEFQKELRSKTLGTQKWWTKYLFHFTDISNSLLILETGFIYSREKAIHLNLMKNDNANDSVIKKTSMIHKEYARLYFAPSTPTQYRNEGIRPKDSISENAHCPIPIMFVFNFIKIFMINEIKFTDGNLATDSDIFDKVQDLNRLNFNDIYHRTRFYPEDRNRIINARHSEILVKDKLILQNNLSLLIVRSEAEKETLLYQMSDNLIEFYKNKIFIQPKVGIFINEWFYIESLSIIDKNLHIKWHYCSNEICKNKFELKIIIRVLKDGNNKSLLRKKWYPTSSSKYKLPEGFQNKNIEVTVFIDNIKCYINSFDEF
ncbi:MAG: DarT ssDNA thymidine ADP-ribosyltransferase family protein [Sulfurovum sp.]